MDAKLGFDENAEFRQSDVFKMRDPSQEDASEVEAAEYGLNYIKLDGSIGCLVNGAGLVGRDVLNASAKGLYSPGTMCRQWRLWMS